MLSYGPAYPLYCILDFIVDSYAELTARLNTKIGDIEATLFHSEFDREAIQDVYSLRRNLLGLRNAAQPVEEICTELIRIHEELIPKPSGVFQRYSGSRKPCSNGCK